MISIALAQYGNMHAWCAGRVCQRWTIWASPGKTAKALQCATSSRACLAWGLPLPRSGMRPVQGVICGKSNLSPTRQFQRLRQLDQGSKPRKNGESAAVRYEFTRLPGVGAATAIAKEWYDAAARCDSLA